MVSAKTARPIAVTKLLPLSRMVMRLEVRAPLKAGQTLFASLLGERIVATSTVERESI